MKSIFEVYLGSGLLLIIISIPLVKNWIKPNPFYGFRVKKTLEDPEIWYLVNAYSGKRLLLAGIFTSLSSLILFIYPGLSLENYSLTCLVLSMTSLTIAIIQSLNYLKSIDSN
jgi:uncharacterized membrane protein